MTGDELRSFVDSNDIRTVRLLASLPDGRLAGKYLAAGHLIDMFPTRPNISDVVLSLDAANDVIATAWSAWRGEMAELYLDADLATIYCDPRLGGLATVVCDLVQADGSAIPECPRGMVRRLLADLARRGYSCRAGFEMEFVAFEESFTTARRMGYRGLTPLGGDKASAYSVTKSHRAVGFLDAVTRRLEQLGIEWESWLDEAGNGQFELNLEPAEALRTADQVTIAKMTIKEVAEERGLSVTFMAKWHPEHFGGGMHCNHSLWAGEASAFFDAARPDGRSDIMHQWVGGLMATLRGAQSLFSPNINSYRRLVELTGAPTTITWGGDNKTTAMRAMAQSRKSARVELRVPASDSNPYVVLAAALAGGLAGLNEDIEPPPPFEGMAWALPDPALSLPNSITSAAEALAADHRLIAGLGQEYVDYWIGTRRWEWLMFHTNGGDPDSDLTDWELHRYFEQS